MPYSFFMTPFFDQRYKFFQEFFPGGSWRHGPWLHFSYIYIILFYCGYHKSSRKTSHGICTEKPVLSLCLYLILVSLWSFLLSINDLKYVSHFTVSSYSSPCLVSIPLQSPLGGHLSFSLLVHLKVYIICKIFPELTFLSII